MTLAEIRDWLKTFDVSEHYYIGRLDNKQEKSLGVYSRRRSGPPVMALGGLSSYDVKAVSLLLHWNQNAWETEDAALRLWNCLFGAAHVDVPSGAHIQYVQPNVPEPVAVGTDEGGVYEYVIELNFYCTRAL